jgi:WD40 repeat protein
VRQPIHRPGLAVDTRGARVAVSTGDGRVVVVPVAGGEARTLEGFSERTYGISVAFSPDGRRLAAAPATGSLEDKVIRLWDLESGTVRVLGPLPGAGEGDAGGLTGLSFVDDDHVVASSLDGVRSFDLRDGRNVLLSSRPAPAVVAGRREHVVLAVLSDPDELVRVGVGGEASTTLFSCPRCTSVALDATETIVAPGSDEGIVRVGPAAGGEPHFFFGRASAAGQRVAFSPDSRWVASSGERPGVRLWPVPDVTRTPLHRRPYEDVLDTLHSWTNLCAVREPQAPAGWKLEPDPFPGWEHLPER